MNSFELIEITFVCLLVRLSVCFFIIVMLLTILPHPRQRNDRLQPSSG